MLKDAIFFNYIVFPPCKKVAAFLVSEVGFYPFFLKVLVFGVHGSAAPTTEAASAANGEFLVVQRLP